MIFRVLAAAALFSGAALAGPQVAITFDDLPAHGVLPPGISRLDVAHQIVEALKAGGIPPTYGFINGVWTINEPASTPVLAYWRESGNLLGNHTWSHPGLSSTDIAAYEENTLKNEPLLAETAPGSDWHVFRYPFIDEGKDETQRGEFRKFLAEKGYRIATVTTGLNDWDYPEAFARCMAKSDTASVAKLEEMYLKRAEEGLDYSRKLAAAALGREVPYIMLMHIGAFQAHMLPQVIARFKEKGVTFISFDEAMKDPVYAAYADPSQPSPPRSFEHMLAKGQQPPAAPDNRIEELKAVCK